MSTSTVLSPRTPAIGLSDGSPSDSRSRRSARAYPTRRLGAGLSSPVPTNASSSTSHSTRSRTRQSTSPEKKPVDGVPLLSSGMKTSRASEGEDEGESEIEIDQDGVRSGSQQSLDDDQMSDGGDYEPKSVDGNETDQPKPGGPVTISLRFGSGKKRKTQNMIEIGEGNESDLTPEAEDARGYDKRDKESGVGERVAGWSDAAEVEGDAVVPQEGEEDHDTREGKVEEELESGLPKRAPRKKRKWLKKGEVDPDDPIAVAKQKERHALIDEAIILLDKQLEMITNESHPQLAWMLQELERRYKRKTAQLEARHEAILQDLDHVRQHERRQAHVNWTKQCDRLAQEMTKEIDLKLGRLDQEHNALKRRPNEYPNMRDGRGGGGWRIYNEHLLSTHEEKLVRVDPDSKRVRRDLPIDVTGIGTHAAKQELARMVVKIEKRSPSPPPRHRRPSRTTNRPERVPDDYSKPWIVNHNGPTTATQSAQPSQPSSSYAYRSWVNPGTTYDQSTNSAHKSSSNAQQQQKSSSYGRHPSLPQPQPQPHSALYSSSGAPSSTSRPPTSSTSHLYPAPTSPNVSLYAPRVKNIFTDPIPPALSTGKSSTTASVPLSSESDPAG
ncbi:hypothetical protein BD324DRAFT_192992 [Kockovaella imperatae]|uniref:Sds3-like-domain-containing protein n=1 Tax=Kockovaella imperatae TaxID=4999 RepID=A0A1Y1U953_9TREE|nr:hypothetical protein BD324DRAFT_192992 [Kockovaella imperatae]ORX34036.1 hypothetical protein BD324DRAFT_192992 [Kockovaella imperatae]